MQYRVALPGLWFKGDFRKGKMLYLLTKKSWVNRMAGGRVEGEEYQRKKLAALEITRID